MSKNRRNGYQPQSSRARRFCRVSDGRRDRPCDQGYTAIDARSSSARLGDAGSRQHPRFYRGFNRWSDTSYAALYEQCALRRTTQGPVFVDAFATEEGRASQSSQAARRQLSGEKLSRPALRRNKISTSARIVHQQFLDDEPAGRPPRRRTQRPLRTRTKRGRGAPWDRYLVSIPGTRQEFPLEVPACG